MAGVRKPTTSSQSLPIVRLQSDQVRMGTAAAEVRHYLLDAMINESTNVAMSER
jgi:hypothetical protein